MLTEQQIASIVEELKTDQRVLGILLTGSYIYGIPTEESDLDVRCVVTPDSGWAEKDRTCFGVTVDLLCNSFERVHFYFDQSEEEGHGAALHFWTYGKNVYDPQGLVAKLQEEARIRWENGPAEGQPWGVRKEKYRKYLPSTKVF